MFSIAAGSSDDHDMVIVENLAVPKTEREDLFSEYLSRKLWQQCDVQRTNQFKNYSIL